MLIMSSMNLHQQTKNNLVAWLKEHWLVLILAFVVGLVSVAPYYLSAIALGPNYHGLPLLAQDSEGEYLGRIQELAEGHYGLGSSVFYEYKDWPALVPALGEWLYFLPTLWFGFPPIAVAMLFKFLLPALLFLLVYTLLLELTKGEKILSLAGALTISLGFDLTDYHFLAKVLFGHFDGLYLSLWTRLVNPITGALGLVAVLILAWRIYQGDNKRFWVPGLLLGLLIGYFFSFVYAGIFISLLLLGALLNRRTTAWPLAGILGAGALAIGLLIGPLVLALLQGQAVGGLNDPRLQGLFYTHLGLFNKFSGLGLLIFAVSSGLFYWWQKIKVWREPWWQFLLALLMTNLAVYNIQLILGWTIWPQHFTQYTNLVTVLALFVLVGRLATARLAWLKPVISALTIGVILLLVFKIVPTYPLGLPLLADFQDQQAVYTWLNEKTLPGQPCVVLTVQDDRGDELMLNRFIPALTACDVYRSFHIYQGVPRQRVWHNLMVWLWLKGLTPEQLPKFLDQENFWIRAQVFRDWRDMFCCGSDPWIDHLGTTGEWQNWYRGEEQKIVTAYPKFLDQPIRSELKKYRLDYVIVDKQSHYRADLVSTLGLQLLDQTPRYLIYRFP